MSNSGSDRGAEKYNQHKLTRNEWKNGIDGAIINPCSNRIIGGGTSPPIEHFTQLDRVYPAMITMVLTIIRVRKKTNQYIFINLCVMFACVFQFSDHSFVE